MAELEGPETQTSASVSDQSSSQDSINSHSQDSFNNQSPAPVVGSLRPPNGTIPMHPIMYPAFIPGLMPPRQDNEQLNRGPGLYAVPVLPYMQPITGFTSNSLIPFTYNLPTEHSAPVVRDGGGEQGQQGEQLQQQHQAGPERRVVVRRFQIAIHLDLFLILKLAAVIFLFNQDGSRQRLTLLVLFASLVYLYQTGALTPLIRWLSQGMHRAAAPPRPPRNAVGADNIPEAAAAQGNGNAGVAVGPPLEGENENQQENDGNVHAGEGEAPNRLWVIVKEIQMIVFGFITSLLPGFHNID